MLERPPFARASGLGSLNELAALAAAFPLVAPVGKLGVADAAVALDTALACETTLAGGTTAGGGAAAAAFFAANSDFADGEGVLLRAPNSDASESQWFFSGSVIRFRVSR